MYLQTPAHQAAFELGRPRAQIPQPIVVGGLLGSYPAMIALSINPPAGLVVAALAAGGVGLYTVRRYRQQLRAATGRVLNSAFNLIGLGRLRDASDVLDVVAQKIKEPWAMRLVDIQQATIAIRRGDMAAAEARLSAALARPIEGFARENALYQLEGARALRAFVHASLGKHAEARADIAAITGGGASQDALARVALAEAMLLEQQGKREELRLLLAEKSTLLLEHTHPRERAIVRAFQRMVRSDKSSVYRRAEARREAPSGEEPMLADWVAKVAPGAAEFVRSPRQAEQAARIAPTDVVYRPTNEAVLANRAAKQPAKRTSPLWIGLGVVLGLPLVGGLITWLVSLLQGPPSEELAPLQRASDTTNIVALLFVLGLTMLPVMYTVARGLRWAARARAERQARAGAGASRALPDEEQLRALSQSASPSVAAQAWLLLADRAERKADFAGALAATTSGLSRLSDPKDRAAADIVYPDLLSLRAFALAAQARFQEANAELASLGPGYPHFSRAVFRARLLMLLRAGDFRGAAHWVDQGEADLPLSVREELLADLVRATMSPEQAGAGEIQRLKDELRAAPEAKEWIRAAAPGLLDAFEGATMTDMRVRIDTGEAREQLAEEEAAAALEMASAPRFAQ